MMRVLGRGSVLMSGCAQIDDYVPHGHALIAARRLSRADGIVDFGPLPAGPGASAATAPTACPGNIVEPG